MSYSTNPYNILITPRVNSLRLRSLQLFDILKHQNNILICIQYYRSNIKISEQAKQKKMKHSCLKEQWNRSHTTVLARVSSNNFYFMNYRRTYITKI